MRAKSRGQALIETAITLPLLLLMAFVVLTVMAYATAKVKLNAATSLAAAAAAQAPIDPNPGANNTSRRWAEQSFDGTLSGYAFLRVDGLDSADPFTCRRTNTAQTVIRCKGRASLELGGTPLGVLLSEVNMEATSEATAPTFRSLQ